MIDLKSIVSGAVNVAFQVAEQIQLAATFSHYTDAGGYSTASGQADANLTNLSITAIFGTYKANEVDGERILTGDRRIVVKVAELAGNEAQMKDFIVESGVVWNLMHIDKDPTNTVYIFQGRKRAA
jgi:hypothetical protein